MQWSNDTQLEQEVLALKKVKLNLEGALANEKNERVKVEVEVADCRRKHKDDIFRLSQEQERAVVAEKALAKKTEEWKQSDVQKANAVSTNLSLEKQLKAEQSEVKRLEYQLHSSAHSPAASTAHPAHAKLVQESAALQRRLGQLEGDLARAEQELERERTAANARAAFGASQARGHPAAKVLELENQLVALQAENAKLAQAKVTSARTSITPADNARSRFGFGGAPSTASAIPARPGSSMGHNLQSNATGRRRSSSFSALPSSSAACPTAQLERDLAASHRRADALDKDLVETKAKLAAKECLLLQCENKLMAVEKKRKDEQREAKADKDEIRIDLDQARREAAAARNAAEAEQAAVLKELRDEKVSLSRQVDRLAAEADKNRVVVERLEARRDELDGKLSASNDNLTAAKETIITLNTDKRELEAALANQTANAADVTELTRLENEVDSLGLALATATAKVDQLEARDVVDRSQAQAKLDTLELQMVALTKERNALSAAANALEAEWAAAKDLFDQQTADTASWPVERAFLEAELEKKDKEIAEFGARLAGQEDALATAAAEVAYTNATALAESAARAEALEAAHAATEAALADVEARLSDTAEERDMAVAKHAEFEVTASDAKAAAVALASKLTDATEAHIQAVVLHGNLESAHDQLKASAENMQIKLSTVTQANAGLCAELASSQTASAALALTVASQDRAREDACAELAAAVERCAQLEDQLADAATALERLRNDKAAAVEKLEAQVGDALEHAAYLEATLGELSARSYDNEAVHGLQSQLVAAEASLKELEQQVVDLTSDEINAQTSRSVAEHKIAQLEGEIARLNGEVDRLGQEADQMNEALVEARAEAAEANMKVDELGIELVAEASLREEAEAREVELGDQVAALEGVDAHFEAAQDHVASLEGELESAKEKLAAAGEEAAATSVAATNASFEITKLRRQLELTQVELQVAEQELAQLKGTLATVPSAAAFGLPPSPTRTSLESTVAAASSHAPSPMTSIPHSLVHEKMHKSAVLVQRLREERDHARVQLDFARTEAHFQLEAIRGELQANEDAKAAELSELQFKLMETATALEGELEASRQAGVLLQEIEKEARRLEDELEHAKAGQGSAGGGNEDDIEELQGMLEVADQQKDDLLVKIEALEEELDQARVDRDHALVRAADASAPAAGSTAAADVARLEEEIDLLQGRVLRRTERIGEHEQTIAKLQQQLALAGVFDDDDDDDDTVEIVVEEPSPVRAEAAAQTEAGEEVERELEGVKSQLADAQEEVIELRGELEASQAALAEVEAEVERTTDEMGDAQATREAAWEALAALQVRYDGVVAEQAKLAAEHGAAASAKAELEAELAMRQAELAAAAEQLAAARASVAELTTELAAAQNKQTASPNGEVERAAQLESDLAAANAQLDGTVVELATVRASLAKVEASVASLGSDKLVLEAQAVSLEKEKVALAKEVAEHEARAKLEMSRAAGLENQLAEQREVHAELQAAHAELDRTHAGAMAQHDSELDQVEQDFNGLMHELQAQEAKAAELAGAAEEARRAAEEAGVAREEVQARLAGVEAELGEARKALLALDSEAVTQHATQTERERELADARATLAALESDHSALREAAVQAAADKARLEADLAAARSAAGPSASAAQAQLAALEARLVEDHGTIAQLRDALDAQRVQARDAHAAAQESAHREIHQLGQMGVSADQTARGLQEECARLEQAVQDAQASVAEAVERLRGDKAALEERVARLSGELAAAQAGAAARSSAQDAARICELEQRLEAQAADVEETDEKYLAVLKQQKRQLGLIEKLKVRVESLQRDLRNATAAAAAPAPVAVTAPTPHAVSLTAAAIATLGSTKKRTRADDGPAPSPAGPRPIVAPLPLPQPRSVTRAASPLMGARAIDKENAASPSRFGQGQAGPAKSLTAIRADEFVPLKPAASEPPAAAVRRVALGVVKPAAAAAVGVVPSGLSKTDELRARLAARRL